MNQWGGQDKNQQRSQACAVLCGLGLIEDFQGDRQESGNAKSYSHRKYWARARCNPSSNRRSQTLNNIYIVFV